MGRIRSAPAGWQGLLAGSNGVGLGPRALSALPAGAPGGLNPEWNTSSWFQPEGSVKALFDPAAAQGKPKAGAISRRLANTFGPGFLFAAVSGGVPNAELYNPIFVPDNILHLMRLDPIVGLCLEITKAPLYGIAYSFEGGDPEIRAFLNAALLPKILQHVEVVLRSLDFGRQSAEIIWKQEDVKAEWAEGKDDEGKPKIKKREWRDAWTIAALRDVDPLMTRIIADGMGELLGVSTFGADGAIPRAKLVHAVHNAEFGSLYGYPQTHRAFRYWKYKAESTYKFVRYIANKGDPPLIGRAPGDWVADETSANAAEDPIQSALSGLMNLRGGGVYVMPHEVDPESKMLKWSVETLNVAARALEFVQGIDMFTAEIFYSMTMPPSIAGERSFAASKVAERVFYTLLDRIKNRVVLDTLNEQEVKPLARANFAGVPDCDIPYLTGGAVSENSKEIAAELFKSFGTLVTSGKAGDLNQVASMVDWAWVLRELGMKALDPALVPTVPAMTDVQGEPVTDPAAAPAQAPPRGLPGPGQPSHILPDATRPDAPGRPGAGLAREVIELAAPSAPTAEAWFASMDEGLRAIDKTVQRAEQISAAHAEAVAAQIRAVMVQHVAAVKTEERPDGVDALRSALRVADKIEAAATAVLERSVNEDLLDIADITGALKLGYDPSEARDEDGKWTDGGGGGVATIERTIEKAAKRAAPGSQLHPETLKRLKELGGPKVKLPAAHIPAHEVKIGDLHAPDAHERPLAVWKAAGKDGKPHSQYAYAASKLAAGADEKWARVQAMEPEYNSLRANLAGQLASEAPGSSRHAGATAAATIAETALRPGGSSGGREDHFGVTTMLRRHVEDRGDHVRIAYVGKEGQTNTAEVRDPATVRALRHYMGAAPSGDARLIPASAEDARAAAGTKLKDFRTVIGTKTAQEAVAAHVAPPPPLSADKKKAAREVAKVAKGISERVAARLNNTPTVAKGSYVHPQVWKALADKLGWEGSV